MLSLLCLTCRDVTCEPMTLSPNPHLGGSGVGANQLCPSLLLLPVHQGTRGLVTIPRVTQGLPILKSKKSSIIFPNSRTQYYSHCHGTKGSRCTLDSLLLLKIRIKAVSQAVNPSLKSGCTCLTYKGHTSCTAEKRGQMLIEVGLSSASWIHQARRANSELQLRTRVALIRWYLSEDSILPRLLYPSLMLSLRWSWPGRW